MTPYVDLPREIKKLLETQPTARTNDVIQTTMGDLTIITYRVSNWNTLINTLPCIYIDIDSSTIFYEQLDQTAYRNVPIVLSILVPLILRDDLTESEKDALDQEVDTEIKRLFGDVEEVLNSGMARKGVVDDLQIVSSAILFEPWDGGDELAGIKLRVASFELIARSVIR